VARYCPNCSAALKEPELDCWNCGAQFGPQSAWAPTDAPVGPFNEREGPPMPPGTGAAWKIPLLALVFLATFVPYAIGILLANPIDLISFVAAWVLLFVLRRKLPPSISLITPLICGLILALPLSYLSILLMTDVHFYSAGGPGISFAYFFLCMLAAHELERGL